MPSEIVRGDLGGTTFPRSRYKLNPRRVERAESATGYGESVSKRVSEDRLELIVGHSQ